MGKCFLHLVDSLEVSQVLLFLLLLLSFAGFVITFVLLVLPPTTLTPETGG